jgi:pheromone alpha factor receptor
MATNSVDPFNQSIVLSLADGVNMTITMDDLKTFTFENIRLGLVYGCAIGLSALMFISLLLLTQPGKRRSPIYVLNVIALVLDIIRSSLMAAWLDSMWNHPVTYFEGDYSRIGTADIAKSVAADVVKLLELGTILVSLTFQVRVIMSTAPAVQRALVLSIAFVVVMVIICVKLAVTVVNARNIANFVPVDQYSLQYKLSDASEILQLVGVGIFLIIFMTKLGIAIRQRYRLGQSKFGPMQMVFIGSLQSMAIPSTFLKLNGRYQTPVLIVCQRSASPFNGTVKSISVAWL